MTDRNANPPDTDRSTIETARAIVRSGPVCSECLGRAFARQGRGLSNGERGDALRTILEVLGEPAAQTHDGSACWVCAGAFDDAEAWAERAVEAVAGTEFETYRFGTRPTRRLEATEDHFEERFALGRPETFKHAFNREVGKRFDARFQGKTVAFQDPDVSFLIDLESDTLTLQRASIYLYGRYRKLRRGIPQTRWPCRRCRGRGCEACEGTGKQYPESVEELVAAPFVEAAQAEGERFHGAGREDIDARMLGRGRPFVLELREPRCRSLDLEHLRGAANRCAEGKVEITPLVLVDRRMVERVKETKTRKRYRASVSFSSDVDAPALTEGLASLVGPIEQRTPRRVAHRRSDLVRTRRLEAATGRLVDPRNGEIELLTEGGLYVKELVSGDGGRSMPSLAAILGIEARVTALDVLDVEDAGFPDSAVDIPGDLT